LEVCPHCRFACDGLPTLIPNTPASYDGLPTLIPIIRDIRVIRGSEMVYLQCENC